MLYQRAEDGFPEGADDVMREGYGPIPSATKFQLGFGYEIPVEVLGWQWSATFNRWAAVVRFFVGQPEVVTFPDLSSPPIRVSVDPAKIGHRIADIGPGGTEHNVQTVGPWPQEPPAGSAEAVAQAAETIERLRGEVDCGTTLKATQEQREGLAAEVERLKEELEETRRRHDADARDLGAARAAVLEETERAFKAETEADSIAAALETVHGLLSEARGVAEEAKLEIAAHQEELERQGAAAGTLATLIEERTEQREALADALQAAIPALEHFDWCMKGSSSVLPAAREALRKAGRS